MESEIRERSEVFSNTSTVTQYVYERSGAVGTCTLSPTGMITITNTPGSALAEYKYREMQDIVIPDFYRRRSNGEVFNNPMTSVNSQETRVPATWEIKYSAKKYGCTPARWYVYQHFRRYGLNPLGSYLTIPDDEINVDSLKDQVVSKSWANIGNEEVLAIVAAAEFDKTVVGLTDLFKQVFGIISSTRRKEWLLKRKGKKLSDVKKAITELYMNARYNLRPIYYDTKGLIKVIKHEFKQIDRQTFRSNLCDEVVATDVQDVNLYGPGDWGHVKVSAARMSKKAVEVRAGVLTAYELDDLAELMGVHAGFQTAFELIPFSFIAGWFLNVGDVLCSLQPQTRFRPLTSWVTTKIVETQTITPYALQADFWPISSAYQIYNTSATCSLGNSSKIVTTVIREPSPQRPLVPRFRLRLDPLKILDLAIITRKIRRSAKIFRYR